MTNMVGRGRLTLTALLLALSLAFAGLAARSSPALAEGQVEYTSFYVDFPLYLQAGSFVYPVRYLVPKTVTPARASMEALIAGIPGNGGLRMIPLPKDTKVLGVSISNGVCTVDFSGEIRKLNVGSGGEAAVISAIVTTLGQFAGVDYVKILVDGQPLETLAGHVDISGPIPVHRDAVFQVLSDVQQHWSGGAVAALEAMDVIAGFPDGTFKPENKVTRGEFIKMLTEALGIPDAPSQPVPFRDVPGTWHEPYVKKALASGLLNPSEYGADLNPDQALPREEMARLLIQAKEAYQSRHPEVTYAPVANVPMFSDLSVTQERYRSAVQECARLGFLLGFPDGTFRPRETLKRSEAATVLTRVLGMPSSPGTSDIVRMSPLVGAKWDGGSLNILGASRAFEGTVNWRLKGSSGDELMYGYTTATLGMGWGVFGLHIDAALFAGKTPAALDLFLVSMKDGSEYSLVSLPLERQ